MFPPGCRGKRLHPFDGLNVHWTFRIPRLTSLKGEGDFEMASYRD
jgi:hypothetical protein